MNKYILLFAIFCATLLSGCGSDEPDSNLFRLSVKVGEEFDIQYSVSANHCNVTMNGWNGQEFSVIVDGNYDSLVLSDNNPDWILAFVSSNQLNIVINSKWGHSEPRIGKIGFTVFKGKDSEAGYIEIKQNPLTREDFEARERKAIQAYLSKFSVIETLPANNNFQIGANAPFYKLTANGDVYMQVVSLGTFGTPTPGDQIYFRFTRYNLDYYLQNGYLPQGEGNANDISASPSCFIYGSIAQITTQWGKGLQMPMALGLPLGSEVNLVIASALGIAAETSAYIPYLYNVRYYPSQM